MSRIVVTEAQREVLDECNVDAEELRIVRGKAIRETLGLPDAWTDGGRVVLIGCNARSLRQWQYYVGAEGLLPEAVFRGVTIFGFGAAERLARYVDDETA